jgi:hypothetical protein
MNVLAEILKMKNTLDLLEKYQRQVIAKQNQTNILFQVRKLPTDCFNYVFSYLSLTPFDKTDFLKYHNKNVLKYSLLKYPYARSSFGDFLVGFKQGRPVSPYNTDIAVRVYDYPRRFEIQMKGKYCRCYDRILSFVPINSKADAYDYIQQNLPNHFNAIKNVLNYQLPYSKLHLDELCSIVKYYLIHYN